jgi:hypothetical protein
MATCLPHVRGDLRKIRCGLAVPPRNDGRSARCRGSPRGSRAAPSLDRFDGFDTDGGNLHIPAGRAWGLLLVFGRPTGDRRPRGHPPMQQ